MLQYLEQPICTNVTVGLQPRAAQAFSVLSEPALQPRSTGQLEGVIHPMPGFTDHQKLLSVSCGALCRGQGQNGETRIRLSETPSADHFEQTSTSDDEQQDVIVQLANLGQS